MAKKKGTLGRGLSALLKEEIGDLAKEGNTTSKYKSFGNLSEIPIDSIETNPFQPRSHFDQEALEELAQSIAQLGVIQPITVRKIDNDTFQLISGERRLRASQLLKKETIPAFVRVADDTQLLEMAIVENVQREELDPIEVALSYHRLMEDCGHTQQQVADRLGKKRASVANFLRLLQLPPLIQAGLRDQMISFGHAKALLSIAGNDTMIKGYTQVVKQKLSVRQTEELSKKLNSPDKKTLSKPTLLDSSAQEKELGKALGIPCKIQLNGKGKGKVTLSINDAKDLEKLIAKLRS